MPGNSFVAQNRPRIFNRRANVKVFRLRIVSWNEKETGGVFVVDSGRIHETAWARRFECFGQLPNLETPEIFRDRDEMMFLEEIDHLGFATLVRFQERLLVRRNIR